MNSASRIDSHICGYYFNKTQSQPSVHVLQHGKFSRGEDLSEYIADIQEKTESSNSFFSELSLKDHQSILMLILAHWIKYNDSDYIKLFIQVLPYYLTALETSVFENHIKSYLPTLSKDNDFDISIKNLQTDTKHAHRSKDEEFSAVKELLLHFGIPPMPLCPMGTFTYSLTQWVTYQHPKIASAGNMLTKFLCITEDWNVSGVKIDRSKTAFDLSCHILSIVKDSKFWFRIFHANKASPLQYLTPEQIQTYYKTARDNQSFYAQGYKTLIKELIPRNADLACSVSCSLDEQEIGLLLKQFLTKKELTPSDIQIIKDILNLPWDLENEDTSPLLLHLETIKTLAEKTTTYKYVLHHKVRDKAEEIASSRRILIVKKHIQYTKL